MKDQKITQSSSASTDKLINCKMQQFNLRVRLGGHKLSTKEQNINFINKNQSTMNTIFSSSPAEQPMANQIIGEFKGFTIEVCRHPRSLAAAYHLRYRAYIAVGMTTENSHEMLVDDYDEQPNSFTHLVWFDGKPVATIRSCVYSAQYDWKEPEGVGYFREDISNSPGRHTNLIESNRFAVDPGFQGASPYLPRCCFSELTL